MEILFEVALLLLEVLCELALAVGGESYKVRYDRENHDQLLAWTGYLVLGAVIGGLSLLLIPRRFLAAGPYPGVSLVLSPLVGGATMFVWGEYRREGGHEPTNLATFWGGASLLFGYALVRFLFHA